MAKVLFSFRSATEEPTIEKVCQQFGFTPKQVDEKFGVVEVDDVEKIYTIMVEEAEGMRAVSEQRMAPNQEAKLEGPYSNPTIAPFGPPLP